MKKYKKQIVITGGLGFIGHHLVKKLISQNYYPIIVDNLSNGRLSNIRNINKSKYYFIKCDIRDFYKLKNSLKGFKPELYIHLAAVHFIPYCNTHIKETLNINVDGTKNILRLLSEFKINNFIFASSAAVYKTKRSAHKENEKQGPIDIYGFSKQIGEKAIIDFSKKNPNFRYTIMRLFNVYGPGDLTPHFIPEMIKKISVSSRIKVGNINTQRDYIYVDDVVSAVIKILSKNRKQRKQIYNVGTGQAHSGVKIIKIITTLLQQNIEVENDKSLFRKKDSDVLVANVEKIYRDYQWKPKYNIYKGMKKICNT